MKPGQLVKVGTSYGEELTYLVRTRLGNLDSQDFAVTSGDLGIVLSHPVVYREGWPSFVMIAFSSGKKGYINDSLLEKIA